MLLVFISMVLVVLAFIGGAYVAKMSEEDDVPVVVSPEEIDSESPDMEVIDYGETEVVTGDHALAIDWADDQSVRTDMNSILVEALFDEMDPDAFGVGVDAIGPNAFIVGTVDGGIYDGYRVTSEIAALPGLGTFYEIFYVLTPPEEAEGKSIILDRYSSFWNSFGISTVENISARDSLGENELQIIGDRLTFDAGAVVAEFETASVVRDTDGNEFASYSLGQRLDFPEEISLDNYAIQGALENGLTLYADDNNLFFSIRKDLRKVIYDVRLPIWSDSKENVAVPNIRFTVDGYNSQEYMKGEIGGCGFRTQTNVVSLTELPELMMTGNNLNDPNDKIYEPVSLDGSRYAGAYSVWRGEDATKTLEQFAAIHPFIYYQDSLGRWIEFRRADTLPAVECGKPVIYLYPEEVTDVTVKLDPQGGFSVTEPAYNDGWTVTAYPDGHLFNHGDKTYYPYLFWEGRGGLYEAPNKFWVVKQVDVQPFLTKTLFQLGLNRVETSDFLEFWLPRMQDAPYYKIGFHGTNVMDMIAPLELSEEPDTVVRILMDYQELQAPIKENPPQLPKRPVRDGFTVIEWGGVIQ